jgi:hypothetical protein
MPPLALSRVILFTPRIAALAAFYRDTLGLEIRKGSTAEGWVEFEGLALHRGSAKPGSTKLVFGSTDVKKTREELIRRGVSLGPVKDFGDLVLCDGHDPDGNPIQLSNRPRA